MTNMLSAIVAALFLFIAPLACLNPLFERISLHLTPEKITYVTGEFVFMDLFVTNLTSENITVPFPTQTGFVLKVILWRQGKDSILVGFRCKYEKGDPTVTLQPDAKLRVSVTLLYLNTQLKTGSIPDISPGKYKVWAILEGAKSNEIDIEIAGRSADEITVHKLLEPFSERNSYPRPDPARLIDIIRSYPKSVYLPNTYYELMTRSAPYDSANWKDRLMDAKRVALDFISRFPNSGLMERAIGYVVRSHCRYPKDRAYREDLKDEIEEELDQLAKEFPDTRLSGFIEERLNPPQRTTSICSFYGDLD